MAGAGKSTLAPLLASALGWRPLDTDRLVEAHFGRELQDILEALGPEEFVAREGRLLARLGAAHCVISTGGSVVYSEEAVARLKLLGPVVHLRISLETFLARVGTAADRGFVRLGAQTLEGVFAERRDLYARAADFAVDTDTLTPEQSVAQILKRLKA